ncbi:MAG: hypothetical protein JSW46_15425 [Gemmatimonadota bacterium]|nr:MAG: hypothetical protein JSW46_15425 [Gemmatimonadota bacterium]
MIRFPRTGAAHASLLAGGLILSALALANLESCANVQVPPGGPPDSIPPMLIAVYPDSYAVVAWTGKREKVQFEFDESISEQNVQIAAILYPFEPRPNVDKGKRELRVRPRAGWVPDRLYHVRIEPVVQDLFRNRIEEPIYHILSTGMPISENEASGSVIDRIRGERLPNGRVDMVLLPDTLRYGAIADSSGAFTIGTLPVGDYYAIGYEDLNNNMRADDFDRSDTLIVSVGQADTLALEFRVFKHDTLGPALVEVTPIDSLVLQLGFDSYLDPDVPTSTEAIEVLALADSSPVALDTVYHAWRYTIWSDSIEQVRSEAEAAARDSAAAAQAAEQAAVEEEVAEEEAAEQEPPAAVPPTPPAEEEEGTTEEAQEPAVLPDRRLYVIAAAPIPPGSYLVRVYRLLNLTGLQGDSEVTFEQPEPEPLEPEEPAEIPPDTAGAEGRGR